MPFSKSNIGYLPTDLASITISYIEKGWAKQDAVLKAKELTNTTRKLTEDEKLELAYIIQRVNNDET